MRMVETLATGIWTPPPPYKERDQKGNHFKSLWRGFATAVCPSVYLIKEGEKGNPEMCPEYNVNYGRQSEVPTGTPPRDGVQPWRGPPSTKACEWAPKTHHSGSQRLE